jgi:hypothetical protein
LKKERKKENIKNKNEGKNKEKILIWGKNCHFCDMRVSRTNKRLGFN